MPVLQQTLFHGKTSGFSLEDKYLKRAGLDYWDKLKVCYYDSFRGKRKYKGHDFYYQQQKQPIHMLTLNIPTTVLLFW